MNVSEASLYPPVKKLLIPDTYVQELDVSLLPSVLGSFVEDGASRMQCPPDFVAVTALCSAAASIGASMKIQPKANDDQYVIVPTLWGALVGAPSSMKSPSISFALRPLESLEESMRSGHRNAELEYKANRRLYEINLKQVESKLSTSSRSGVTEQSYADLAMALENEPQPPTEPRIVVNDSTVPKLGELMNANPRGLFLVRDELAGWLSDMQGEAAGADRAFYLEAFNGNSRFTYDRISRGTIHIENCCLSVLGGLQPSKLKPIVSAAASGKLDDGLLQRLQLAVWPAKKMDRRYVDKHPDESARLRFENRLDALLKGSVDSPKLIRFSTEAQVLFQIWWEGLQTELLLIENELFQSFKIKQEKTLCVIACIFQLLDDPNSSQISANSLERAQAFLDYLESHAKKIYKLDDCSELHAAILVCSRKRKLNEEFTSRELQRKGWPGLRTSEQVRSALECLEENGYLISCVALTNPEPGKQAKKVYAWNPCLSEEDLHFDN